MFSWATSQLEILAQTVAPPPTDPKSKFVIACQKGEEDTALQLLTTEFVDPLREVVQPVKGQTAIHLACLHGMPRVVEQILSRLGQPQDQGSVMYILDGEGNTPLHSACMSKNPDNLALIKRLVEIVGKPAVGVKNNAGQTPYDVATLNSIRQYLLPIQLQAETQAALDNGGVGLVPGMDLCGLRVTPKNVAPPPTMTMMQPPPAVSPSPGYSRSVSGPLPGAANSPVESSQPSSMFATPSPHPPVRSASSPDDMGTSRPPPAPPSSGGGGQYAYRGSSSAAMTTVKGIKPDGFHSSSSDKNLQEKYGHQAVNSGTALPPPPSSGNSVGSYGMTGPPSSGNGGANPYSGRLTALGNNGRPANRYVSYDPIQGVHAPPPSAPPQQQPYNMSPSPVVATPSATSRFSSPGAPGAPSPGSGGLPMSLKFPPPPVGTFGKAPTSALIGTVPPRSLSPPRPNATNLFSRPPAATTSTPAASNFPKPPGSALSTFSPQPALSGGNGTNGGGASPSLATGSSFPKPPTMTFTKPPSLNVKAPPAGDIFSRPVFGTPTASSTPMMTSPQNAATSFQTASAPATTVPEPTAPEVSSPTPPEKQAEPVDDNNNHAGEEELMDEVPLTPGQVSAKGVSMAGLMPPPPPPLKM
jgi:hypothetical protein